MVLVSLSNLMLVYELFERDSSKPPSVTGPPNGFLPLTLPGGLLVPESLLCFGGLADYYLIIFLEKNKLSS